MNHGPIDLIATVCQVCILIYSTIGQRLFRKQAVPVLVRQKEARRRVRVCRDTERKQVLRIVIDISKDLTWGVHNRSESISLVKDITAPEVICALLLNQNWPVDSSNRFFRPSEAPTPWLNVDYSWVHAHPPDDDENELV